jgi:hypothetical protein
MNVDEVKRQISMLGELRPGATYAVQLTDTVSDDLLLQYTKILQEVGKMLDVRFVIFPANLKLLDPRELP